MNYQNIQSSGQYWNQWDLDMAKNLGFGASMFSYKSDYAKALDDAGRKAANAGAEALRKQYGGYTSGTDGSKYYGTLTPGGYQSPYQSAIAQATDRITNFGDFQFDQEKPTYQNSYKDMLDSLMGQIQNYGDFSYGPAPTYQNQYKAQLDSLLGQVQSYGPFSWSKENDPAYAAYAKQYRREGQRATQNALAQTAALTGGQPSTAAVTAASQAGDYYAGQLSDKIPELYENAYQRYLSDYSMLTNKLNQTQQAEQYDYSKYLNQLGQYNTDRSFDYGVYSDKFNRLGSQLDAAQQAQQLEYQQYLSQLDQYNTDRNFAYGAYADKYDRLNNSLGVLQGLDNTQYGRVLDQIDYNNNQDAIAREQEQTAWDRAQYQAELNRQQAEASKALAQQQVDAILQAGGTPSQGLLDSSGYATEYAQALHNAWQMQNAPRVSYSSSGGRRSSSGGSGSSSSGSARSGKPKLTWPQALALIEAGNLTPEALYAYEYYTGIPYDGVENGLSKEAQSILDSAMHVSPGRAGYAADYFANKIKAALDKKEITKAEAGYLMEQMGF